MIDIYTPLGIHLNELVRVLNSKGFLILGYPEHLWNLYQLSEKLEGSYVPEEDEIVHRKLHKQKEVHELGEYLILQKVLLPLEDIQEYNMERETVFLGTSQTSNGG
jgi:hypothetical protein